MQHTAVLIAVALMHFIDIEGCNGLKLSPRPSFFNNIWKKTRTPVWGKLEPSSRPLLPRDGADGQSPEAPESREFQKSPDLEGDRQTTREENKSKVSELQIKLEMLEMELKTQKDQFQQVKKMEQLKNEYRSNFCLWRRQVKAKKAKISNELGQINMFKTSINADEVAVAEIEKVAKRCYDLYDKIYDFVIEVIGGEIYIEGKLAQLEDELEKQKQEFSGMQNRKNVFAWLLTTQVVIKELDVDQLMKDSPKSNSNADKIEELNASYRAFNKKFYDFEDEVYKSAGLLRKISVTSNL
jgi:hypothetical protein